MVLRFFSRPRAVFTEIHFDRRSVRAEVKRLLEFSGRFAERYVFIEVKVFHQRLLQMPIVGLHPLRPASPRGDRAFSQRFARIGNHQVGIANQLGAKSMASRACSEMAVEGKMSRESARRTKARIGVSVISGISQFFPSLF